MGKGVNKTINVYVNDTIHKVKNPFFESNSQRNLYR